MTKRPLRNIDEATLVELAKSGSEQAFNEIYKRFNAHVSHFIFKKISKTQDAETVEDFTQQVFMQAFKSIHTFQPSSRITTWLYRIATNLVIDAFRRKNLRRNTGAVVSLNYTDYEGNENSNQIEDSNLTPSESMEKSQRAEYVRKVIDAKLSDDYKEIISLRYFEEKSYDEICEILNLPLGTVKARIHRAKEILSENLTRKKAQLI